MNFYNDNDPKACAWLRELIKQGHLPPGHVDGRSILEIKPSDLHGYTQVHLFAGIGGWPRAFAIAGYPEDHPVWSLSCPCQPLSCAGQRKGHADERHLWPAVYHLIAECRPATLFGEQVASPDGREWFAGVRADLEGAGYACGGAIMPAASVGAPHRRERIFFVADTDGGNQGDGGIQRGGEHGQQPQDGGTRVTVSNAGYQRSRRRATGDRTMGHAESIGRIGREDDENRGGRQRSPGHSGAWDNFDIIPCRDGKARRIESGTFPLAHGIPARMGRLRGYGNAIVPQVAAKVIRAYLGN